MGGSIVIRAGETRGKRIQSAGTGDPVGGGALGAKEEEGARERQSAPPVVGVTEGRPTTAGSAVATERPTTTERRVPRRRPG